MRQKPGATLRAFSCVLWWAMSYAVAVVKWSRFALDLVVVFFSRIGAIGLGMMAGSLLIYAVLGYATGHHGAEGSLAARLEGVVFAAFVVAMIFFAIGCTLQQRDLEKVRREVGEVWWRGPGRFGYKRRAARRNESGAPVSRHAAGAATSKIRASGKTMSADDKKSAKKEPAAESKIAEPKTEAVKPETVKAEGGKTAAAPSNKGMGEGQKPVSQAYKDNWNAIFAKKKKR